MGISGHQLEATVMPDRSIQLEWNDAPIHENRSSKLLEQEFYQRFLIDKNRAFLFLGLSDLTIPLSPSLEYWREFCGLYSKKLRLTPDIENLRHNTKIQIEDQELDSIFESAPLMIGAEYLSREALSEVWEGINSAFKSEIKDYHGTVQEFIKTYSPDMHLVGRVFFHLVESKKEDYPFAFVATYSTGLNNQGLSKHMPLKHALEEFKGDRHKLLELLVTVHRAAKQSQLIAGLLESGDIFHPLAWSEREAVMFLKEIPFYEESGILCRIPNWWKGRSSGVRINISVGGKAPSCLGMGALLSFDASLFLEDTPITEEEARCLLQASEGLAFIKNRWVAVDPEKLRQTLSAYEKAKKLSQEGEFTLRDALRMQLNPRLTLPFDVPADALTINSGDWLASLTSKLRSPELMDALTLGDGFKAKLRHYQQNGVAWLSILDSLRLGICLADDMGLGKTVQILALLHLIKSRGEQGASLLVMPVSLLANWESEIKRFVPDLKFVIAHPSVRDRFMGELKNPDAVKKFDLVITTYSLIKKYEWLQSHKWNYVILDEAQAIKNPSAGQTKAVKNFHSKNRIVMTGTPVENSLSDLWSLFDFINPGLLGSAREFSDFTKSLNKDHGGYARLRKVVTPYILRRLKTDKTVISDLPEKVEMKTYASLSKRQLVLYEHMVKDLKETIAKTDGIKRKGLILSALMKFKQLCNHPDHYLGTGGFEEDESGKFLRLREICETIYEKRERVLVFTQFREMTEPLRVYLKGLFHHDGLVLHGGTQAGKRKDIVARFEASDYMPFMVLSLKAGGVGLNLTAANHVIHFDRWWNPAVENQATDRAFRIGQKKNVLVHKFITKGTIEEKIDMMIEGKLKLSQEVIQSGSEAWITEMSNEEIIKLFSVTL